MTIKGENPIDVTAGAKKDVLAALSEVKRWMGPAPPEEILVALGELYMGSVKSNEQSDDRKAKFKLYLRELRKFPGDIALGAVKAWRGKHFPGLAELVNVIILDRRWRQRRRLFEALTKCLEDWDKPKCSRKPVTKEQIARSEAMVRRNREAEPLARVNDNLVVQKDKK